MTTDNFTEAASEEACARFLIDADHPGPTSLAYIEIFEEAAEWARTHLAAQEPTEEEVYAVRLVTHGALSPTAARAALRAARAARRDEEDR